jgi:hypothetical protein
MPECCNLMQETMEQAVIDPSCPSSSDLVLWTSARTGGGGRVTETITLFYPARCVHVWFGCSLYSSMMNTISASYLQTRAPSVEQVGSQRLTECTTGPCSKKNIFAFRSY